MSKVWSKAFYNSKAWRRTSKAYATSVGMLCENCLANGVYTPGKIVHHKTHLTPQNINDANIALAWDNLKLVCQDCHAKEHAEEKRFAFNGDGSISPL